MKTPIPATQRREEFQRLVVLLGLLPRFSFTARLECMLVDNVLLGEIRSSASFTPRRDRRSEQVGA